MELRGRWPASLTAICMAQLQPGLYKEAEAAVAPQCRSSLTLLPLLERTVSCVQGPLLADRCIPGSTRPRSHVASCPHVPSPIPPQGLDVSNLSPGQRVLVRDAACQLHLN